MAVFTESIEKLITRLTKLPGIGRKSAERIVSYLFEATDEEARGLAECVVKLKESVSLCRLCHSFSEGELCPICGDARRSTQTLCVVERPADVTAIERSGAFHGRYHVLQGSIAPLEGKGPEDLKIESLVKRITEEKVTEVILATDSDMEGEATALYLARILKPLGINLSRIGQGLPVGSNLEYADSATLLKSLESRRPV